MKIVTDVRLLDDEDGTRLRIPKATKKSITEDKLTELGEEVLDTLGVSSVEELAEEFDHKELLGSATIKVESVTFSRD